MAFQPKQYREGDSYSHGAQPYAPRKRKKKSGWGGGAFLFFFALFWSALVLVFDGFIGYGIYKNWQAQSYHEVPGKVLSSEVERHRSDDGYTYQAEIEFTYQVDGRTYTHDEHAYGVMGSSDRSLAREAVRKFPKGRQVTVYYNPDDPQDAVLDRSFESIPWFMLLFMMPFNMVMLGLWAGCGYYVWKGLFGTEDDGKIGGFELVNEGFQTRLKMGQGSPLFTGAVAIGLASFLAIFPIAFLGMTNNMYALVGAAVVIGLCGVAGAYWQFNRNLSGSGDLVIDRTNMKLIIPAQAFGSPTELSLMELNTVGVKTLSDSDSTQYAPTVTYVDVNQIRQEVPLCKWQDEDAAIELADWLRAELGLHTPEPT